VTLPVQLFKTTSIVEMWIKCARGGLKLPKRKSRFGVSKKRLVLEGMFSGEVLSGRVRKEPVSCVTGALAGKYEKSDKK